MPQRRSPRLSVNPSKKFGRRIRIAFDWIKRKGFGAYPVFLLLLFIFVAYNLFSVRKIECKLNSEPCPAVIIDKLNSTIGTNSILINQKELVEEIRRVHPVDSVTVGFKMFNTLSVMLQGNKKSHLVEMILVKELPIISLDLAPGSSVSGNWLRPSTEIELFLETAGSTSFEIWENGTITPTSTASASIKYIMSEKPDAQMISGLYNLVVLSQKYLDPQNIYILNRRVFLRQVDQPDIIVNIPFDQALLTEAFQSIGYLATIKKDAEIIDLRFKNPIIR